MTDPAAMDTRSERLDQFRHTCGLTDLSAEDLDWALTHRSYAFEAGTGQDNERLEFLGDAVLSAVASEALYEQYPKANEGELSKLRARMVSRATLGELAGNLGLGELILLGRGERDTGGARRGSTLGSALEALIGLIYLRLGFAPSRQFIQIHVLAPLGGASMAEDYKSTLQEWAQREHRQVPRYHRLGHSGPDHARIFTVRVEVAGQELGKADGARIKLAENEAARQALAKLGLLPG